MAHETLAYEVAMWLGYGSVAHHCQICVIYHPGY